MSNLLRRDPLLVNTKRKELEENPKEEQFSQSTVADHILPPINKITSNGTGRIAVFLEHTPIIDMASLDRHLKSIENISALILQNDCQGGTNDSAINAALRLIKQSMVDHCRTVDGQLLVDRILSDRAI